MSGKHRRPTQYMADTYRYSCTIHELLWNSIDVDTVKPDSAEQIMTEIISLSITTPEVQYFVNMATKALTSDSILLPTFPA